VWKTTLLLAPEEAIRLLGPPSPDRLNTLSSMPPLETAGPPLGLQPRRRLPPPLAVFPSSAGELCTARTQHPCRRGRAAEPPGPHGEVPCRPIFSLAMGRPHAAALLCRLCATGRNSPLSQLQWTDRRDKIEDKIANFCQNLLKTIQIRSKTCFSKLLHKTPSRSASTSVLAKQTYYLVKIDMFT
jgi:hypothetical protein